MNKKELLGLRIKELRKQRGLTQDFLAEKLHIEPRQLSKLETGKHYPSFETILRILETFNITFEELIEVDHFSKDLKIEIDKNIEKMNDKQLVLIYKMSRSIIN